MTAEGVGRRRGCGNGGPSGAGSAVSTAGVGGNVDELNTNNGALGPTNRVGNADGAMVTYGTCGAYAGTGGNANPLASFLTSFMAALSSTFCSAL